MSAPARNLYNNGDWLKRGDYYNCLITNMLAWTYAMCEVLYTQLNFKM